MNTQWLRRFAPLLPATVGLLVPIPAVRAQKGGTTPPPPPPDPAIAYVDGTGTSGGRLFVCNADGTNKVQMSGGYNGSSAWSPDNSRLAFIKFDNGAKVCTVDITPSGGANETYVTSLNFNQHNGIDWSPTVTPDGTERLLFVDTVPGDPSTSVYAIRPDGTGLVELLRDSADHHPSWNPTATRFVTSNGYDIRVHDVAVVAGNLTVVGTTSLVKGVAGSPFAGKAVDHASWGKSSDTLLVRSGRDLYRMNIHTPTVATNITNGQVPELWWPQFYDAGGVGDARVVFGYRNTRGKFFAATIGASGGSITNIASPGRYTSARRFVAP